MEFGKWFWGTCGAIFSILMMALGYIWCHFEDSFWTTSDVILKMVEGYIWTHFEDDFGILLGQF
jgi:hypothetical protein